MSDIIDQLATLKADIARSASEQTVQRDVLRGRAALRKRRARRTIAGLGVLTTAAAAAALVIIGHGPSSPRSASPGLDLVGYKGAQVPGFAVGKVPAGFELHRTSRRDLEILPHGIMMLTDDPKTPAVLDPKNRIIVRLRAHQPQTIPGGKSVVVNERRGWIFKSDRHVTRLYYTDKRGHSLVVQMNESFPLTQRELINFAEALDVADDAETPAG